MEGKQLCTILHPEFLLHSQKQQDHVEQHSWGIADDKKFT